MLNEPTGTFGGVEMMHNRCPSLSSQKRLPRHQPAH